MNFMFFGFSTKFPLRAAQRISHKANKTVFKRSTDDYSESFTPWIWFSCCCFNFLSARVLNEITRVVDVVWWNTFIRLTSHDVDDSTFLRFTCVNHTTWVTTRWIYFKPRPANSLSLFTIRLAGVWNHKLLVIKLIVWVFNRSWAASCVTQNEVFINNFFLPFRFMLTMMNVWKTSWWFTNLW